MPDKNKDLSCYNERQRYKCQDNENSQGDVSDLYNSCLDESENLSDENEELKRGNDNVVSKQIHLLLNNELDTNKKTNDDQPRELRRIEKIALEQYKEFISSKFLKIKNKKFISKNFLENLVKEIKSYQVDLSDKIIAAILYGTSNGSEALAFATLKSNKFNNQYSLIDENLLDKWYFNLKLQFPNNFSVFFNLIKNYKLLCAEIRVFDLVDKWNSYCSKIHILGLNMETKKFDFIESILKGTLIENFSFKLSCNISNHKKFFVTYKHLSRAICPLCSRIEKSFSYQDFVREAELRNAIFKFSESEFNDRINEELKKPCNEQQKVSEILFPFICKKHGEFYTSMERIKNYNNWCAECYYESRRLTIEQIIARGKKYNFNLKTPLEYITNLTIPSREELEWSCKYHPNFKFKSRPDDFSLDQMYCGICSGGQITNERIIRYLLSRLFNRNFGEKPTSMYEILPFNKVINLVPNDYCTIKSYKLMHFDAFAYVDINIERKTFTLSVAVEYWDREHTSLEEYIDRFKHRSPRSSNYTDDYRHLKSSDKFKQNLKDNGLIDIYIVIEYPIRRDNFLDFLISEFEQQIRKLLKINNYQLRNIPHCNWRDLKQIDKLRQTFGDVIRFI